MFTIRLAGVPIAVDNKYDFVYRQCKDYFDDALPAFTVSVAEDEIDDEWAGSLPEVQKTYPDKRGYSESVALYRKICHTLPLYGALLVHSAALCADGKAYLFSAPPGTGKTTHLRLWMRNFKGRVSIINGDKPLVRLEKDGSFKVFGTPWSGKEGWHHNVDAPLGAVCFIERGTVNTIEKLPVGEAADRLMQQILYPKESAALLATLRLADGLLNAVPSYLLHCDISDEAARLSFSTLTGGAPGIGESGTADASHENGGEEKNKPAPKKSRKKRAFFEKKT